mgnify:CR=1 FL=1
MNKERIAILLREPARVAREDLVGLGELTERYPWFCGAQFLQAMARQNSGEVVLGDALSVAAAHLPSREILFDALRSGVRVLEVVPHIPVNTEGQLPVNTPQERTFDPGIAQPTHDDMAQRILEQQILEAAAASAYELTHEIGTDTDLEPPILHLPDPSGPVSVDAPLPMVEADPIVLPAPGTALRFADWLELAPALSVPPPPGPTMHSMVDVHDWTRSSVEPPGSEEVATKPSITTTHDPGELIERFIQHSVPAPLPKVSFFNPQEAGKRSLLEQADLVTETLARIYEAQGHVGKAIAAYERLAAKHPDRAAHFRALAKALEGRRDQS